MSFPNSYIAEKSLLAFLRSEACLSLFSYKHSLISSAFQKAVSITGSGHYCYLRLNNNKRLAI